MDSKYVEEQSVPLQNERPKGFVNYVKYLRSQITLEPMWFGISCSLMISIIAYKNLYLQRACLVDLGFSEEVCFNSTAENKTSVELQGQKIVSSIMVGSGFAGGLITIVIVLFLGPWSDASGRRKPMILIPMIGMIAATLSLLIIQAFPNLSSAWVIYLHAIPLSMGGHFSLLGIAAFSHLGDICYKTGRSATTVMGSNSGFFSLFMVIGTMLGPLLYRTIGFVGLFSVTLVLELSSFFYVIFYVHDVNVAEKIPSVLDITLPIQAMKCVFKKRAGKRRRTIMLMVAVPCFNSLVYVAEVAISYLYLRNKFDWTELEYSLLLTYKSLVSVVGAFIILVVFNNKMKMKDEHMGIIGGISQMIAAVGFMFSNQPHWIFITSTLGIFSRAIMMVERPILNKQISADEQGKVTCITSLFEKVCSFIIVPLVNYIYSATLTTWPSTFMIIVIIGSILQMLCFVCVTNDPTLEKNEEDEKKEEI